MSVTITHAKVVLENHNVHTNGLALGVLSRLWWQRGHPCSLKRVRGVSARDVFHDRHGITLQEETMRADRGVLAGWPLHGCSAPAFACSCNRAVSVSNGPSLRCFFAGRGSSSQSASCAG